MSKYLYLAFCFIAAIFATTAATGATLGLPIFSTAPATVSITNQFGNNMPTPSYTLNVSTTIAAAQGAPELIGQLLNFSYFFDNGFNDGSITSNLSIGGVELLTGGTGNLLEILPPFTDTGSSFVYSGIFAGFGPNSAAFPDLQLQFSIDLPIPTKDGFFYCDAASNCEFSNTPGLTVINGQPVTVFESFLGYPEGTISGAVLSFSTVNGRPVSPVPLPASALLLLIALTGLVLTHQMRSKLPADLPLIT